MRFIVVLLCLLPQMQGEDRKTESTARSPDGQWEYRSTEYIEGGIVEAGTANFVVYLADNVPYPQHATVLWAPDSKRFAYTASPPHPSHTSYDVTTVYQLRGDEWQPAEPLVEEATDVPQVTQLAKERLPKSKREQRIWKSSPGRDVVRAVKWIDADTLVVDAHAQWDRERKPDYAAFLFTLKFDTEGKWKIVRTEDVTNKKEADQ